MLASVLYKEAKFLYSISKINQGLKPKNKQWEACQQLLSFLNINLQNRSNACTQKKFWILKATKNRKTIAYHGIMTNHFCNDFACLVNTQNSIKSLHDNCLVSVTTVFFSVTTVLFPWQLFCFHDNCLISV